MSYRKMHNSRWAFLAVALLGLGLLSLTRAVEAQGPQPTVRGADAPSRTSDEKISKAEADDEPVTSPSDRLAKDDTADQSADIAPAPVTSGFTRQDALLASLTIFVLAIFVGFEVITKVPPTLHTPLMSGSNAISGITIVGALIVAGSGLGFDSFLGFIAVILATINVVGGFLVTHRMLAMFKKR
jgi:NAD(P) transhydrogenase subunit alpha